MPNIFWLRPTHSPESFPGVYTPVYYYAVTVHLTWKFNLKVTVLWGYRWPDTYSFRAFLKPNVANQLVATGTHHLCVHLALFSKPKSKLLGRNIVNLQYEYEQLKQQ